MPAKFYTTFSARTTGKEAESAELTKVRAV
jgi:hypothetical protein